MKRAVLTDNGNSPEKSPQTRKFHDPNDDIATPLSLLLPGVGQWWLGRNTAFAIQFSLFLLSLIVICFSELGYIIYVPLVVFSVLDTLLWRGKPYSNRTAIILWTLTILLIIFIFLLFPGVQAAREGARLMQCVSIYKQLGLAFYNYHDKHGCFPPAYTVDANGKPLHSWRVLILPYIEGKELYDKIRLDEPWDSEYNKQFHTSPILWQYRFQCPTEASDKPLKKLFPSLETKGRCSVSVVIGEETPFPGATSTSFEDITDRRGDTILLVERLVPVCWMDPNHEITLSIALDGCDKNLFGIGSFHNGVVSFGSCDGSCGFIPKDISREKLRAMLTKSGGETIEPDEKEK